MAVGKPRGKDGMRPVFTYDPAVKRKRYVGERANLNEARALDRQMRQEFQDAFEKGTKPEKEWTYRDYSEVWIDEKHGPGTKRPARTTLATNKGYLKVFLEGFGDRLVNGGVGRREALKWCKQHPYHAWTVAAMVKDAIDDEVCTTGNVWANRQQESNKGRKHITPLTEHEVYRLGEIALKSWRDYGATVKAMLDWSAGVGTRPAETASIEWRNLDMESGEAKVRRCKPPYNTDIVIVADRVIESLEQIPGPREGQVFKTVQGKAFRKWSCFYYWTPVRNAFMLELAEKDPDRLRALLDGRDNIDLYDLRHHVASVMADRGADEYDISAQLGNSPEVCRATYIHPFKDRIRERNREVLNRVVDLGEHRKKRSA